MRPMIERDIMSSTPSESPNVEGSTTSSTPLPEAVDWLLGALIALGGLIFVAVGAALVFGVDRELLEQAIEEETTTVTVGTTELTDPEALEVADAFISWVGPGLLVTGLGMIVFAIGYIILRRRAHRRARTDDTVNSYRSFAVLGAVITAVLSFIPASSALGGAVAGYLEKSESDRTVSVGVLAGVLPLLPLIIVGLFSVGGLVTGLLAIEQGENAAFVGITLLLSLVVSVALGAGLGGLGGYLGGWFAERRTTAN